MKSALVLALLVVGAAGCGDRRGEVRRTIEVVLAADNHARQRESWEKRLRHRVRSVSKVYADQFGIDFHVEAVSQWNTSGEVKDLPSQRRELKRSVSATSNRLLIGFTGREWPRDHLGFAIPFSNAVLVVDSGNRSEEQNTAALAHELAHLFSASHVSGTDTIMSAAPLKLVFDSGTADTIRRYRRYEFGRGLDGLSVEARDQLGRARVGTLFHADGNLASSIAEYREAVRRSPADVDTRMNLATALLDSGQSETAIQELEQALALSPTRVDIRSTLSAALSVQGNDEAAIALLEDGLRLIPADAALLINLGSLYARDLKRMDKAIAVFERALRADPGNANASRKLTIARNLKAQRDAPSRR